MGGQEPLELIKLKKENVHDITHGFLLQGEQAKTDEWMGKHGEDPYYPPKLHTIPIKGRLLGKAIEVLIRGNVIPDDEHSINVVYLRADNLKALDEEEIRRLVSDSDDSDAEKEDVVQITKEVAATIEILLNGGKIKDGGYFAFYWCDRWSMLGGIRECSHLKTKWEGKVLYCAECGVVIPEEDAHTLTGSMTTR